MILPPLVLSLVPCSAHQEPAASRPVLRGFDPVDLVAGQQVVGSSALTLAHEGFLYAFSTEEHRGRFRSSPEAFAIQLGGACGSMGPLAGAGDPDRFLVHGERIYVFASDACRTTFEKAPERYIDVPDLMPRLRREQFMRGKELLDLTLAGVGGVAAVDGLHGLRLAWAAQRGQAPETYAWREELSYDFVAGGRELVSVVGDWKWRDSLTGTTGVSGEIGKETRAMNRARRAEFERQTGRELPYLLRARGGEDFMTWATDSEEVNGRELEKLVVRAGEANTTLFVDPDSGRVLRSSWRGRLGTGAIGEIVVDFADFETVGALTLPQGRTVTFDGERQEHLCGRLATLAVN